MKTIVRSLTIFFVIVCLSACSYAPGIPGLKTSPTKPQKEGVDYKVVVINADTIRKQQPFDYASFVRAKKQRISVFRAKTRLNNTKSGNVTNKNPNTSATNTSPRFEGITSGDSKANYHYHIGKGDILNITVWDHPELTEPSANNGGHLVDSDGHFYFPYSGEINALGKTVGSIRDELERKLGSFITKPQVSVNVAAYRSQKIYISGAVTKPATLMVNDTPITIRDAISNTGGLVLNKYTGYATLGRKNKNISIDLNRMLKFNDNRQNFILRNGDRLHIVERTELAEFNRKLGLDVQRDETLGAVDLQNALNKERSIALLRKELEGELRSEQAKVFVMGEVVKPGSVKYQVEEGMTLAEAINDAGSFKESTVNPAGIFVVRKENISDEIPTVYQLPIASVQSMYLAEQFDIRPRDIVYATATPSVRWNKVLSQLLPSLAIINAFGNFR